MTPFLIDENDSSASRYSVFVILARKFCSFSLTDVLTRDSYFVKTACKR